jgi:hypothetical protein
MWFFPKFYTSISKNYNECKMQLMSSGFNNIEGEWFNSHATVNNSRYEKKITNSFKYKCETLSCYVCFNIY